MASRTVTRRLAALVAVVAAVLALALFMPAEARAAEPGDVPVAGEGSQDDPNRADGTAGTGAGASVDGSSPTEGEGPSEDEGAGEADGVTDESGGHVDQDGGTVGDGGPSQDAGSGTQGSTSTEGSGDQDSTSTGASGSQGSSATGAGDVETVTPSADGLAASNDQLVDQLLAQASSGAGLDGIDISGWQGNPLDGGLDPSKIEADFVIVKVSEGTGYENPYWRDQVRLALSAGKLVGLYHYAIGGASMEAQANYFVTLVRSYENGALIGQAVLFLDWEDGSLPVSDVGAAKEWLDEVKSTTGVTPLIYMNQSTANGHDWSSVRNAGYKLWLSQYLYSNYDPVNGIDGYRENPNKGSYQYGAWGQDSTIYQYTSTGRLPGYSGFLDFNKFYGDRNDWLELAACLLGYWQQGSSEDEWYFFDADGEKQTGWLVTSVKCPATTATGLQRFFLGADGRLAMGRLVSADEAGYWAYARPDGLIVRGRWVDPVTGYVYLAGNDGRLLDPGWHITDDFGQGLQRYWVDAAAHACVPGYSADGYAHVTTEAGYVLRGYGKVGGRLYRADNDGRLYGDGWLVTSAFGQGLQRYWLVGGRTPEEGVYATGDGAWTYVTDKGYVLRGALRVGDLVYLADNDGRLAPAGWVVSSAYGHGLQRYWVDAEKHAAVIGYSTDGYAHVTTEAGYVLRGYGKVGGRLYRADNDGRLYGDGWLVTSAFGQGLQRYWLVGGRTPEEGVYATGDGAWTYVTDKGYVLRGTYVAPDGTVYVADNDGRLTSPAPAALAARSDGAEALCA